ncbi:putative cystathionine gamma-synthase [Cadophora sp. DSE1049]|nr:putative cystathionine gamma-synthase [Cadophora sp. DSE1049]
MKDNDKFLERNWIHDEVPRALPVGQCHIHPPTTPHAVSSSLPTWDAVISWSRKEKAAKENVEYSYPRFFIARPIQMLIVRIRERFKINDEAASCMVFPSTRIANYCATELRASSPAAAVHTIRFCLPDESAIHDADNVWTDFLVVLFPTDLTKESMLVWMDTGAGITTRHAEFCLEHFNLLASDSSVQAFRTSAVQKRDSGCQTLNVWSRSAPKDMKVVRERIAQLVTSENSKLERVKAEDVFIFPTGMSAIFSTFEALAAFAPDSDVVAYGWVYPETVHNLKRTSWSSVISFKWGTEEELDQLEHMLTSPHHQITTIVCELPSNIKLISPNLERIRTLADKHNIIVVCDETAGNFINVDVLPYVDVVLSSLTKMFSGASDANASAPSSVVINPNSRHYDRVRSHVDGQYDSAFCFPPDVAVLKRNSVNMASRVHKANANTLPVVELLLNHLSVEQVNHPSLGPTSPWYEKVKRRDGGYGNVLSVVFRSADFARRFYDSLDVCKGSSFGTNFTLAVPYVQLACYWDQDKCEKYGLPRHIIRISVGLEDPKEIVGRIEAALREAEMSEGQGK